MEPLTNKPDHAVGLKRLTTRTLIPRSVSSQAWGRSPGSRCRRPLWSNDDGAGNGFNRLQWRDRAGVSPASLLSPIRGTPTGWIRLLMGMAGRMFSRLRRYCKASHSQRQCLLLRGLHSVAFTYNGRHQPCSASIGWATARERVSPWKLGSRKGLQVGPRVPRNNVGEVWRVSSPRRRCMYLGV